jgi:uncharacterized sporulation protein YeaH/YhbH (DUF444 family)
MPIIDKKFKTVEVKKKADIWPAFKKLFGKGIAASSEG